MFVEKINEALDRVAANTQNSLVHVNPNAPVRWTVVVLNVAKLRRKEVNNGAACIVAVNCGIIVVFQILAVLGSESREASSEVRLLLVDLVLSHTAQEGV